MGGNSQPPMSFPDLESLICAAEIWKFQSPNDGESEAAHRQARADHVEPKVMGVGPKAVIARTS